MSDDVSPRLARVEERLDLVTQLVEQFGPIAGQVLRAELGAQENARDLKRLEGSIVILRSDLTKAEDEMHESLRRAETRLERSVERVEKACTESVDRVEQACKALGSDLRTYSAARAGSRATIIVGALGASGTILAVVLPRLLG